MPQWIFTDAHRHWGIKRNKQQKGRESFVEKCQSTFLSSFFPPPTGLSCFGDFQISRHKNWQVRRMFLALSLSPPSYQHRKCQNNLKMLHILFEWVFFVLENVSESIFYVFQFICKIFRAVFIAFGEDFYFI